MAPGLTSALIPPPPPPTHHPCGRRYLDYLSDVPPPGVPGWAAGLLGGGLLMRAGDTFGALSALEPAQQVPLPPSFTSADAAFGKGCALVTNI